eukprot:TRINITY_DN18753_c0_g2_i1.p1 TRINITY_DN18753_c0_g2~~TRINITY_DN18753_c0_g2_i1.p1  ORF type:complete len:219 (-),score=33.19 TRINITY_DN18753_c0_g2_i1:366-1022(-)
MSNYQHLGSIECEVVMLGGSRLVVHAESSWKVWQLKEEIATMTNMPIFEQHLVKDTCVMCNSDILVNLVAANRAPHLQVWLSRWRVPDTICDEMLLLTWQGFLAFSKDSGGTIEGARAVAVMRYAGLHECATLVSEEYELPGPLAFADFVALLAELKASLIASSNLEGIREFDFEDDSDEDSEQSSDEPCVHDLLRELNDSDLRCDARLLLKGRRNTC